MKQCEYEKVNVCGSHKGIEEKRREREEYKRKERPGEEK
jgi:hypothetical protein